MDLKRNITGNGYIIDCSNTDKSKEKLILKAIRECLHRHPSESISVQLNGDKIIINLKRRNEEINNSVKLHR